MASNQQEEWEVEKILDQKGNDYLIRWRDVGDTSFDDTWVSRENIEGNELLYSWDCEYAAVLGNPPPTRLLAAKAKKHKTNNHTVENKVNFKKYNTY